MATEAEEIPAAISEIRNEGMELDRNIVDQATILPICKLSQEDKFQADEPKEPLTPEGDNFLITPSAGGVQSEVHITVPETSEVAENLDQAAKDCSLLGNLKSGDQLSGIGANEGTESERIHKNAEETNVSDMDEGRGVALVKCSNIENQKVEANMGSDKTGDGKTTDEETSFNLKNDVSKYECQNTQKTVTTEQETTAEGSQETSALESTRETTDDRNPKVTEKSSLTEGDGLHMECNPQLDKGNEERNPQLNKENEELPEISTGSTIGHESSVNLNIREKDKDLTKPELLEIEKDTSTLQDEELQMEKSNSGPDNKAIGSLVESTTGADLEATKTEDTEEQTIDTPETKKEVIEVQGTPKSCLISHEEGTITADHQEITNTSENDECMDEVGMKKDVLEIVSNEEMEENLMIKVDDSLIEVQGLQEGGKTPSTSLTLAGVVNDDELVVAHDVQNEGGQNEKAFLCENEEHTEGGLPKIETKMEKEEHTLHVDPGENKASDIDQEVADSQGILDEQTDNETVDAATREETSSSLTLARGTKDVEMDIQNEDGQMTKAELCEYEEQAEKILPNIESKMEKERDTLQVTSKDIKASSTGQKEETSSLEKQNVAACSQGILDEQTHNKAVDAAKSEEPPTLARETNDGELVVEPEVQNEDEQLKKAELCENEEHAEDTFPKIETDAEKGKHTLQVISEENKASDLCQEEERSSLEQQSLIADQQGSLDEKTGNTAAEAATKEESVENVARVDSNEQNKENSLIHFEGLQMKDEVHLEKESEKPISIQNFTEDANEVTLKGEIKLEDEKPVVDLLEKEKDSERSALMDEGQTGKSGKSLNVSGQSTETSCLEEPSFSENQQTILDEKTEDKTNEPEATNHIPQKPQENVATKVSKENDNKIPLVQIDAPQMNHVNHDEHLENKRKPSKDTSIEKEIQTAKLQEISCDNTEEHIVEVADTTDEDKKDVATNISNMGNDDASPTAENSSPESTVKEVYTSKSSDHELENALEAILEDESSSKSDLEKNEECTTKEIEKPPTESSSVELIQIEDLQNISSDTKKEIADEAHTKDECAKDIATNEETSPTMKDDSQQSQTEVFEAKDHEPVNILKLPQLEDESSLKTELVKNEICPGKEIAELSTETSSEKQIQIPDPREILIDKSKEETSEVADTKEETTGVADTKEESTKDIATYVPNRENEDTTPVAEDSLEVQSQKETSNLKANDPEPENMLDAEFGDESSIKSEFIENEKCVDKEMDNPSTEVVIEKQTQPADTQEISSDKTKEEIAGVANTEQNAQDIAITVPKQENEDTLEEDDSKMTCQKEASSENELEDKFEDKNSPEAELVEKEKSTEKVSVKEDLPIEFMHVADKDVEVFASREEIEDTRMVSNGESEELPSFGKEGLQKPSMEEASTGNMKDDYTAFIQEGKLEDKNTIITELKERCTEETLITEESVEYMEVVSKEGVSSQEGEKTSSSEKEWLELNHGKINYDQKEDQKFDEMDTKIETLETKDIAVDTSRESEDNSQVVTETSQHASLEAALKNESTIIHEANNPLQGGLEVNDSIVERADQNVSAFAEDTGSENCIEQLEVDGTTKNFLADEKNTENELERECKEEKVLLDETEDIKEPASTPGATEFITKSPETSDLNMYTSGKELTIDREKMHAVLTGDNESLKIDEDKGKQKDESRQKTSDFSQATAEANEVEYAQIENKSSSESEKQDLEDIVEDQTCSILSKAEDTRKEEKLKAAPEIQNDHVLEEDILSKKNKGADDNTEYHHVSSCEEDVTTEKQPEGARQEKCGTQNMHKTEKEKEVSEEGIGKDTDEQENLLANESVDGSIEKNLVEKSIEEGTKATESEKTQAYDETKTEDSKEGIATESQQKNETEKAEMSIGEIYGAKKDSSETEKVPKASEESAQYAVQEPKEEKHETFLVSESLDRSLGQNQEKKSIEESTIIADTEETHVCTEDSKEVITTKSGSEDNTKEKEINIAKTCEAKKDPNETEKESKVSEENAQYAVYGPQDEQHESLLENESLNRSIDQNQVEKSIEDDTTIAAEDTQVCTETKTDDSEEGITIRISLEDTEKEERKIGETYEAQKDANEAEKESKLSEESAQYAVHEVKQEDKIYEKKTIEIEKEKDAKTFEEAKPEEDIIAKELIDRSRHQNEPENSTKEVAKIIHTEEAGGTETDCVDNEAKITDPLDRSIDQNQAEKSIEGDTTIAAEDTHVSTETKTEDSEDTEKEERKIGETHEAQKDVNEAEKESNLSAESAQYAVDEVKQEDEIYEKNTIEIEKEKDDKTFEEAEPEENIIAKELVDRSRHQNEPENSTKEVAKIIHTEEAGGTETDCVYNEAKITDSVDRSIDQNQVEKSIEDDTTIAAEDTHVCTETKTDDSEEGIKIRSSLEDTEKEERKIGETNEAQKDANEAEKESKLSEESAQHAVHDVKQEDEIYEKKTIEIEKEKDAKTFEEAEPEEDIIAKELIDRSRHQNEPENTTKEVAKIIHTEEAGGTETDCVDNEAQITDSLDRSIDQNQAEKSTEDDTKIAAEDTHVCTETKTEDSEDTEKEQRKIGETHEAQKDANEAEKESNLSAESAQYAVHEVKQDDEIYEEKTMEIEKEKDAKTFEEAEPEEDIIAKESIDRSRHQNEPENSTKEVETIIHTEEAGGTETNCVDNEAKITDSIEEIIAESHPKDEAKKQETIEKEICEVKVIVDETMKEPKIIEEAKQEPQEDITENKSIDRSLHQKELKNNIEEETTLDSEQHATEVYLETKTEDSREERVAESYQEFEVKQEQVKEKETCEVKNTAAETLKVSRDFEMVAGKAVQESESENVDGSLQQKQSVKSVEQVTPLFNNEGVHAEDTEKGTENSVEKEIESYPEETDEMKQNATEMEKVCKTSQENAEMSVQDLEDNSPENVDKSLHEKEQGKTVDDGMTTVNTEDVYGIINVHMETGVENLKEKAKESHREDEVKSKEINIEEMCEGKKNSNETESVSNDSDKVAENVAQETEEPEKAVEVVTAIPEIEKAHRLHIETGNEETKEEEYLMLSESNSKEETYEADTHSKPKQDDDKNTDVEAESVYSSHAEDRNSQDILNSNENSNRVCHEENYPNKGNESQISTVAEDIEPVEQTTEHTAAVPEFMGEEDQLGIVKAAKVESRGAREVSNKRKAMTESNILEAEDNLTNHDLPQEPCIRDSDANIAESVGQLDHQNMKDIGKDEPDLSESSTGLPIQENPLEASPIENKKARVSSEDQEGNIIQQVIAHEVTLLSEKDKQVVQKVDCSENVNPGDSTGKNNNVDPVESPGSDSEILKPCDFEQDQARCMHEESASQETTKSMEKSDLKDTGKPSLSYLFNASTKERQTADDPVTLNESAIHGDDHQVGENDDVEHDHAKQGEEKCADEESDEKITPDMTSEAPVLVDAGDAEVKVAHKKSHNILSGVGSKVKHSISKVKKAITGKSSPNKAVTSPK